MATTRWRAAWGIGLLGLGACSGSPDKADAGEARDPVGLDDDAGAALDSGSRDEPADGDASSAPDAGSADDDSDATTGDPADASTDLDAASADLDAATTGSDAAAAPADAGALDAAADVDSRSAYCTGRGSPIKVPVGTGGEALCTGTIARQRFKNALCTCEGVDFKGYLNTGSFSASEDTTVVKAGGSVGVNGSLGLISAGDIDVGGSLRVYEASTYGGYVHAYGDLELNGWSSVAGYVEVARDAKFRDDMVVLGHVDVGRDVYTRPGKWEPPLWSMVGGRRVRGDFTLDEPCACGPEDLLDVGAIVRAGRLQNDNDDPSVMLSPGALVGLDFARTVTLPCGRFYLDAITGVGDVKLVVNGRTALYVGGDVATIGRLDIELGPEGELDLFIAGDLTQVGFGTFGDVDRPSAVRVYVGGDGDIFFRGYQPFGANLYAPKSRLHSDGFIDARGAFFLRTLDTNGYLKIAYDRDVLEQGNDESCRPPVTPPPPDAGVPDAGPDAGPDASVPPPPPPPPECTDSCDEKCGQASCKGGACAPCTSDADCCAPLVCYANGKCGALLL